MRKEDSMYQKYINILKTELVPAMGCTEPIAIAYAAALAQKTFQEEVNHVEIYVVNYSWLHICSTYPLVYHVSRNLSVSKSYSPHPQIQPSAYVSVPLPASYLHST